MVTIPLLGLLMLVVLGLLDLWVGVANDAVNFTNSGLGARAARPRTVVLVACAGVLAGALVSDGMMEIARRGIFDPGRFALPDGSPDVAALLSIYVAVMVTDVVLLDLFNSFGMPTSTTVSIVSELVGASAAVAVWSGPGGLGGALQVLNFGTVGTIYTAIFVSIAVAFVSGAVAMALVRLVFTHDIGRTFRRFGWLWVGLSMAGLVYFLVLKGLRHVSVLSDAARDSVTANLWPVLGGVFTLSAVAGFLLRHRPELVLRGLVLAGTFALAMAFAGNDLVNFIGPVVAAGHAVLSPGAHLGGALATPPFVLAFAGLVMAAALLRSRKARTVADTEIRLAARAGVEQRFRSGPLARALVASARAVGGAVTRVTPRALRRLVDARTAPPQAPHPAAPPYDLLRAALNVTLSAALIALATTRRLPLSTTYVTFMVAMGTALGDRRWEPATAEARLTGILVVVGGWLMTGLAAASGAFVTASVLALLGLPAGTALLTAALGLVLYRLYRTHQRRTAGRSSFAASGPEPMSTDAPS